MKKRILSVAIISIAAMPIISEARFKLYSHLQVELNAEQIDGVFAPDNGVGLDDDVGRSRWGIKASEKLANGMLVFAHLAFNLDPADNGAEKNREQYIGIKGGWGSFSAGRQASPYKYHGGTKYDPFVATHLQARRFGGMSGNINGFGHNGFVNNALIYKSPIMFGASFDFLVMPDETSAGIDGDMDYSFGFKYRIADGMEMIVAHNRLNTAKGQADEKMTKVGGQMKYGVHTVSAQFEWISDSSSGTGNNAGSATGAINFAPYSGVGTCPDAELSSSCNGSLNGGADGTIWYLGYQMTLGASTVAVQFGRVDSEYFNNEVGSETFYWSAGVIHKFSKKFRMFVGYAESDFNLDVNGDGVGDDRDAWSMGMRKDF